MKQRRSQPKVAARNKTGRRTRMRQRLVVCAMRGDAACYCPRLVEGDEACGQSSFWMAIGIRIQRGHTNVDLFALRSALLSLRRVRARAPRNGASCNGSQRARHHAPCRFSFFQHRLTSFFLQTQFRISNRWMRAALALCWMQCNRGCMGRAMTTCVTGTASSTTSFALRKSK